jgi:hypothetical protein
MAKRVYINRGLLPYLSHVFLFISNRTHTPERCKHISSNNSITHLPRKHHKSGIQRNRQKEINDNNCIEWINRHKARNPPLPRQSCRTRDQNPGSSEAENKSPLKAFEQSGEFFKEGGVFDLLHGSYPRHVNFEEVAEKSLRHIEGDPA